MGPGTLRLTELEACSGIILGDEPQAETSDIRPSRGIAPIQALISACARHLSQGQVVVSFSGGRDSSLVLAGMVKASRINSLPPPIPVTLRFPGDPDSVEDDHQEALISSLGITQWHRIDLGDEMDLLGPRSTAIMSRLGHLWPANHYFLDPIAERFPDGSIATGLEGDGLFGGWRWFRAAHPRRARDALTIAHALVPARLRKLVAYSSEDLDLTWVRSEVLRSLNRRWKVELASEPAVWNERVRWWMSRRYIALARSTLDSVCSLRGVSAVHPLLDPALISAVAEAGRRRGFASRTDAMQKMFGDLLPASTIQRQSKAFFDQTFWGPQARAFANRWTGAGIPADLVDHEALKQEWLKEEPDFRSAPALQLAWLATQSC